MTLVRSPSLETSAVTVIWFGVTPTLKTAPITERNTMFTLNIITHHGDFYADEDFLLDTLDASHIKDTLGRCAYAYRNVSLERAEVLLEELVRTGETQHGWSTLTY